MLALSLIALGFLLACATTRGDAALPTEDDWSQYLRTLRK